MIRKILVRAALAAGTFLTVVSFLTILSYTVHPVLHSSFSGWWIVPGVLMLVFGFRGIHFENPVIAEIRESNRQEKERIAKKNIWNKAS